MKKFTQISMIAVVLVVLLFISSLTAFANVPGNQSQVTPLFLDVAAEYNNALFINYLANQGLIKGFPDGTFRPTAGLTRAEAAALLVRAAKINAGAAPSTFADVNSGHWAAPSIEAAASAGLLSGYPDGTFRPNQVLTRAEGVTLFLRLSKQPDPQVALPVLEDIGPNHWAARPVAIGLAAGMVGLSADNKRFLTDAPLTRGDLARILGVLFTQDPDLYRTDLKGNLKVLKGTVIEVNRDGKTTEVIGTTTVGSGDVIKTAAGTEAEITFPDGSGLRITENSELSMKETRGRAYITHWGTQGIAVDWLALNLKQGNIFGALATRYESNGDQSKQSNTTGLARYPRVAGVNEKALKEILSDLVAKAQQNKIQVAETKTQNLPWYQQSQDKKVRVQVDMPWSVCAIRGSFWQNMVQRNGRSMTNLLEGEGQVTAAGKTVALAPGQRTEVTEPTAPPAPPTPMTQEENRQWVNLARWVVERARAIDNSMEQQAPPPPAATPTPQPIQQQPQQPIQQPSQQQITLKRLAADLTALNQGKVPESIKDMVTPNPPTQPPGTGGGGGGGGGGGDTTSAVKSVEAINNIIVAYGTPFSDITLPSTVKVTLTKETSESVQVTWDQGTPVYDGSKSGTYEFEGILSIPSGVSNPKGIKAVVKVIVLAPGIQVQEVSTLSDITVEKGTSLENVGLPKRGQITLSDGNNLTVDITWDQGTPAYAENTLGIYKFQGILSLPNGISNPKGLKAEVRVMVVENSPSITSISPTTGMPNTQVTLKGHHFGSEKGQVFIGGSSISTGRILSWNDSEIIFYVPNLQSSSEFDVWIKRTNGLISNKTKFNYQGSTPSLPAAYYGTITVNGGSVDAAPGTLVEVRVGGQVIANLITDSDNLYGNTAKLVVQGISAGTEIEFWLKLPGYSNFVKVPENCTFISGDVKEHNLIVNI
ncbi:S-layer homology domain-containing protein [Desulforamulus reducens]|uniref:S-layer homology domain-containing protein n=1 Tax=Desulforamulus reducens TaxID=59610 RepID=UPI00059BB795|nr:S-layer homology domain-containing protein [Desulforamulus reducens]